MLSEKMTSAERATLMGLVRVTLRTEESARLRYLKEAEVMSVLSQGAHGYQEVAGSEEVNSPAEIKKVDWGHKMVYKRNATPRESSSSARHRQHQRGV